MPVHFRGASEYKTHYKWMDSFKSKSFHPEPEQMMDPAGQPSFFHTQTMEPPLQHKKRLGGPPTSLSTNYFSKPSKDPEYTLLGQQEKFAPNVPYQVKKSFSEDKLYKNKENFDDAAPPSKQLKMQKRTKPQMKEHPPLSRSPRQSATTKLTPPSPPPAPRGHKDNYELKVALKDKDLKDVLEDKPSGSKDVRKSEVSKSVSLSQQREQGRQREGAGLGVKEPAQVNLKSSSLEAPSDYALKYKAGVAPPRPVKKVSEYQKQFQWKDGIKSSPLLAAEEIVYKSQADLGPYKTDGVPKLSEYKRQFQPWKPPTYLEDLNINLNYNNNNNNNNNNASMQSEDKGGKRKRKTVAKRSKSAGAALQRDESAEEEEADDQDPKEVLKAKLKSSHGKTKRIATEYRANYMSPTRFSYDHGAWKGAWPPQLMPTVTSSDEDKNKNNNNNNNNNASENPPLSNWFAEVVELRRRAAEYRKRAQGTHFSREHLVQLMAKQNECWDVNSQASETIKALNLEVPAVNKKVKQKPEIDHLVPVEVCSHEATEGDSPLMSDVDEALEEDRQKELQQEGRKKSGKGKRVGQKKGTRKSRKMAWLEEQKEKVGEQRRKFEEERLRQDMEAKNLAQQKDEKVEGRLPTPLLQQQDPSVARRHHLDLTTPSVGGAILTCPPPKDSKLIVTSRSGESYVTASDEYPQQKQQQRTYNMDKLLTMPTLGLPSGDTHPLRDDSADSDRPMKTQYVYAPPMPGKEEDKENATKKRQSKRKSKLGKPSNLTTVKEGYGKTFNKSQPYVTLDDINANVNRPKDDDVLSVSLQSVASSSSLASDVLERAKKRQQFWKAQNGAVC